MTKVTNSANKQYYSIIVKFEKGDNWSVQFGDYDKKCCEDELEDSYGDCHKAKIIKTAPDQESINAEVARLNAGGK